MRPIPRQLIQALRVRLPAFRPPRDQRGALLMEALVSVGVFTLLGTAVMTGLSASGNAAQSVERNAIAGNLANNQIETIMAAGYQDPPHTFATIPPPPGYSVTAQADQFVPGDVNIAKVVVSVSHGGQVVMVLESLRLKDTP